MTAELVGREREFATVIQAWSDVKRGRGRRIQLIAPAGLGKTRLLSDTANRLRTLGARVVALRAKPGERDVPYALAGELALALGSLPGAAGVAPATASEPIRARRSGVTAGLGASSISFWCRLCTEQSRSPSDTTRPW